MADRGAKTGITSPPAGTGQVPGLGEAFRINLNTGQGVYSYKLPLPAGVAGQKPTLNLEYSHGAGHSPFGFGWRLELRRITRRLDMGVGGGATERFVDTGAEIRPIADGSYRAVRETAFTRYTRVGDGWKIEERDGTVHLLGTAADSRLFDPDHPERVTEWLVERTTDPSGNAIDYTYDIHRGTAYISEVRYAAYAIRFTYEDRPDSRFNGRAGYARRLTRRCTQVELYLDPGPDERLIRSWTLSYTLEPSAHLSLLASIEMISRGVAADGSEDVPKPRVRFNYTSFRPGEYRVHIMRAQGASPPPLTDPDAALVTLDHVPLPGILAVTNGRQHYWRNQGDGSWSAPTPVPRTPLIGSFERDGVAFIDVDASGTADLITVGPDTRLPGYYENSGRAGFGRFVVYPRGSRATPAWSSGRTLLTDADGNGQVDAIMSTRRAFAVWTNRGADGWSEPTLAPKGTGDDRPDVDLGDSSVRLADMTGDGLQDLVRVRSGGVEYWPSLGYGRYGARVVMNNSPRLRNLQRLMDNLVLMDINGDGCADLVFVTADGIETCINRNGESFSDVTRYDVVPPPIPGTIRSADMFGRGAAGLVYNSRSSQGTSYVVVSFGDAPASYLLSRVDSGTGLISEIGYRAAVSDYLEDLRSGELWETHFPFPLPVVSFTREEDAVSGQIVETHYRYHEAHYEPHTRQFQGFRRSERIEKGDESRSDTRTVFHFLMARERHPGNGPEHAVLNGMLRRTEVFSLDGSADEDLPLTVEEADYDLRVLDESEDGLRRVFVFLTVRRTEDIERTSDLRGEERTYDYDAFGNVVRERLRGYGTRGGAPQPERVRVTETEYAESPGRWIIDKPSRVVVRDGAGSIVTEIRRYYDGADFTGLPLGEADRGLMTREEHLVLPQAEFQTHYAGLDTVALGYHAGDDADGNAAVFVNAERHAFTAAGVKRADLDPLGDEKRYEYDASNMLRTKLVDFLGETVFEYDRAVGEPTRIIYADGSETHLSYDAQGRVLSVAMPGEPPGQPARRLSYDDLNVPNSRTTRFRHGGGPGGTSRSVMYYDGRGHEFQERIETTGGRFVVSNLALKNGWGDIKVEFEPTFSDSSAFALPDTAGRPARRFFFDARGRTVKTVNYNGGVSTARYLPFEIITADANDNDDSPENRARGQFDTPRVEHFDVFRERTKTIEASGSPSELTTIFHPGSTGELLQVEDAHGSLARYQYDQLGNRIRIDHREAGDRKIWFDARRQPIRVLDGRGLDMRAEIDPRGRLRRLTADNVSVEEYRYDDPAHNALGRLAEVTYQGGRQVFRYDAAGRLQHHEYHFAGRAAPEVVTYDYDGLGREIARTHGDGTRIVTELTPNGWVLSIPGILDRVDYDARGLPIRLLYANGVVTESTYTDGAGRLATRRTHAPGGQLFEDLAYDYDTLGSVLSRNDAAPAGAGLQRFAYDPLYQLTSCTSDENGTPRTRSYQYTGSYNITRFDEADLQLHYDDPLHPDRVAGLTLNGGTRQTVTHDANGNITDLPGQHFEHNFRDLVSRFENSDGVVAEYEYDHKGIRTRKRVDDGHGLTTDTLFIGDIAEIRNAQPPAYFVHLGHMRVAILQDGNTRFVHSDETGGTAFYSDDTATRITAIGYRPFGNLARVSGPTDFRTYGTHPFDTESGLYYMKRRYYSPLLGRFLSADPLAIYQAPEHISNPKALHPYIYAGNDPVNKIDLDGYSFWSVVGAIVGVIVAIAVAALVVMTGGALGVVLGLALAIGLVAVSYTVASATQGTAFGEFMRGFMIGLNAGLNAAIATALFGPVIGVALGVINFLAAFDAIANSDVYQGILGWSSWLMPMSWLATAVGVIFFVLNVIPAIFTGNQVDAVRIENISIDWGTGTIVMEGGWTFLPGFTGGFNLGNFSYITPGSTVVDHETGHTLSNAAFGSIFHFIGAIDENVIQTNPNDAYSERIAESHDPAPGFPIIPMWV